MDKMTPRKNRRQFERLCIPCHLRYLRIPKKGEEYRNATIQDISQAGFKFAADEVFPRRSCFLLSLLIPGSSPIRSLATVAWIKALPENDGYQVGGKFVEPNPDVGRILALLVSKQ